MAAKGGANPAGRSRKTAKGNQCPLHNGCRYALDWLFRRNQREQGYTDEDEHSRRRIDCNAESL
jgi:hypothetical protein